MKTYEYPAIFTREDNGKYSVDFPDLEGCYTCGDSINDAIVMAHDVLNTVLIFYLLNGKEIPMPSTDRAILPLMKNQDAYWVSAMLPDDENDTGEDPVNHPSHYENSCSVECIDMMECCFDYDVVFDFCICNAFKYIWRHKFKNGQEDLDKAEWYINKADEIMTESGDEEHLYSNLISIRGLYNKVIKKLESGPNSSKH